MTLSKGFGIGGRGRFLLALAVSSMVCSSVNAALTVIGTQYQQDNPYPEYQCIYHDGNYPTSCGSTITGVNAHVFVKNSGGSSETISDVTLAGYSLATVIKQDNTYGGANSIYFYWDNPPQAILDAGEPVWYRLKPNVVAPGKCSEVIVRLRSVPTTATVTIGVVSTSGTVTATVTKNAAAPVPASITFSQDRTKVYIHWRKSGGAAPVTVKMDDADVTAQCSTVGDANYDYAVTKLTPSTAPTAGSFHVYQGIFSDGSKATGCVKTWGHKFLYINWHTFTLNSAAEAEDFIDDAADRGFNCLENQMDSGMTTLLGTEAGRAYAASKGYDLIAWNPNTNGNKIMWFIDDEPDAEEDLTACGSGLMLPCGSGHDTGILVMRQLRDSQDYLDVDPNLPITCNMNGTLKPDNYYSYGNGMDVLSADPYYQARLRDVEYNYPEREPLYLKATLIYAVSKALCTAAEPGMSYTILYSCKHDEPELWPFPTREAKRLEVYNALMAGSKGISYWWFTKPNGLGVLDTDAQALWTEMGLLGNEIKTVGDQIVNSHPVSIPLTTSSGLWAKGSASGTNTMLVYVLNDNYYNDASGCHYSNINNGTVTATLPSWMTSSPTVFEVTSDGIGTVGSTLNGSNLTMYLGTTKLSRMLVITTDSNLRSTIETNYTNNVRPGLCNFDASHCTPINTTPKVILHPTNLSVESGVNVDFVCQAVGTGTISYQWQKDLANISDGGSIAGATTPALRITNVQGSNSGSYRCKVTNSYGSVYTNAAVLSTTTTTECLTNQDFESGFSAQGGGTIANNWTEWESVANTTVGYDETITIHGGSHAQRIRVWNDSSLATGGVYQRIPATSGTVYTASAYIYAQYSDTSCYIGVDRTGGTNAASANVTWSSATTAQAWTQRSVTVTAAAANITIFCKVTSPDGKHNGYFDDMQPDCFQAPSAPTITGQPSAQNPCLGANASFTVVASGGGTLTYQWQKNSANLANGGHYSGCTTATMAVTGSDTNDAANYRCVVTNAGGSATSNQAALTIAAATTITGHPSNQSVASGGTANFYVGATGSGTLTYQWQKNSVNQANGGHYSGCTTATLTISTADTNDAASYRCVVTGGCGSATSNAATLTVTSCAAPTLTNGNFEYSTVGNPPYGWTTYIQATKSGAWTIQTVTPPQGTRWQQTQVYNTGSFGGVRQNVTGLVSGTIYTISGSYRTNSTSATASVRYSLTGNTNRANSTVLVSKVATSWGTFSANVTASGTSLMLFLDHLNGTSSNKASAFDNIKVICAP